MTDIIERLRIESRREPHEPIWRDAIDEIEALRAEVATWAAAWKAAKRHGAQPAPSVPEGFSREDLEAVADGLDGYEKTVNVGNVTGVGDDHLESTTAYAARFIRAMLAAQPAPSVSDTYAAGINAVAAMLQSKAAEYAKEHGHDDMGGLSFGPGMGGEIKMDYYTNLIELVDDVRAMLAAAPEAKP